MSEMIKIVNGFGDEESCINRSFRGSQKDVCTQKGVERRFKNEVDIYT